MSNMSNAERDFSVIIPQKRNRVDIALYLLVIYTVFFEYFHVTEYEMIVEIAFVIFLTVVEIICNYNKIIYRPNSKIPLIWLILWVWANYRSGALISPSALRILLAALFLYWGGQGNTTQHNMKLVNFLLICSLFVGFSIILEFFIPSLLRVYKEMIFGAERYNISLRLVLQKGYNTGALYEVSFSAFFVIVAIGALLYIPKYSRVNKVILVSSMVIALLFTNKRAHLLYLFISIFAVYLFTASRDKTFMRILRVLLLSFMAIVLIVVFINIFPDMGISIRLRSTIIGLIDGDDVSSGRIGLYTRAIELWRTSPLLGIGWLRYSVESLHRGMYGNGLQVHNVFLQTLCESGIIGAVIFTLCVLTGFIYNLKIYRAAHIREATDEINITKFTLYIQCLFFNFSLTGNTLYDMCFFYTYIIALCLVLSTANQLEGIPVKNTSAVLG